eukprot:m.215545 g.215545  ORF g.215545 m.215545 type:complete len:374 (+) comp39833_c3_seq48:3618-4739(+)
MTFSCCSTSRWTRQMAALSGLVLTLLPIVFCVNCNSSCLDCVNNPCSLSDTNCSKNRIFCYRENGPNECLSYGESEQCPNPSQIWTIAECLRRGLTKTFTSGEKKPQHQGVWDCKKGKIRTADDAISITFSSDIEGTFAGPGEGNPDGALYLVRLNVCHNVTSTTDKCANKTVPFQAGSDGISSLNPCIETVVDIDFVNGVVPITPEDERNLAKGFNVSLGSVRCCSVNSSPCSFVNATAVFMRPQICGNESGDEPSMQHINLRVISQCNSSSLLVVKIVLPQLCQDSGKKKELSRSAINGIAVSVITFIVFAVIADIAIKRYQKWQTREKVDSTNYSTIPKEHESYCDPNESDRELQVQHAEERPQLTSKQT